MDIQSNCVILGYATTVKPQPQQSRRYPRARSAHSDLPMWIQGKGCVPAPRRPPRPWTSSKRDEPDYNVTHIFRPADLPAVHLSHRHTHSPAGKAIASVQRRHHRDREQRRTASTLRALGAATKKVKSDSETRYINKIGGSYTKLDNIQLSLSLH